MQIYQHKVTPANLGLKKVNNKVDKELKGGVKP